MVQIEILIEFKGIGVVRGSLSNRVNPKTYYRFANKIPFDTKASTWGEEVFFETPVSAPIENGVQDVEVGDIGFWPPGKAMCLFFGPTPVSHGNKPRAASPVSVIGAIRDNIELLPEVIDSTSVMVKSLELRTRI